MLLAVTAPHEHVTYTRQQCTLHPDETKPRKGVKRTPQTAVCSQSFNLKLLYLALKMTTVY